jgi:predicted  nucleic acid-binding Zn-ribbon protein
MKKILITLIISASLYAFYPFVSHSAFMVITPDSCTTTACKNATAETARLNQEKIDAQKKADQIASQNAAIEAERTRQEAIRAQEEKKRIEAQKEEERIQKENEYQLKIKELEDRIKKLESQQPIIKTITIPVETTVKETPSVQNNEVIKTTISDKKIVQPSVIKKEEPKNESAITDPSPVVESIPTSIQKVSWFKRFLNWFK